MAEVERWTPELQMIQNSLTYLVPEKDLAMALVSEAGIPSKRINFGDPPWMRIQKIMQEAVKLGMMGALLDVITSPSWYHDNAEIQEAKTAWESAKLEEDRTLAAAKLQREASRLHREKKVLREPIAVATVTRKGGEITDVDVEVDIPTEEEEEIVIPVTEKPKELEELAEESTFLELPYTDEIRPGDWYTAQRTFVDHEERMLWAEKVILELQARIEELERWRRRLSVLPAPTKEDASQGREQS